MPPKASTARPQHARKSSAAKSGAAETPAAAKEKGKLQPKETEKDASVMGPPPPPPKPQAILEPEIDALEESLKNTTVTTAQIFRFYADAKRLGVQRHAPRPPRSMTSDLAYEIGRYDQICDALDFHVSRSIAVLQRDLTREENRIREEEAEKAHAKAVQAISADANVEMSNAGGPSDETKKSEQAIPTGAVIGTGKLRLRRSSKISLSTLHRSPFRLKLDLSAATLRLGGDEAGLNLTALGSMTTLGGMGSLGSMGVGGIPGLSSPVTLAPKSARPMAPDELPPEILAALASAAAESQNVQVQNQAQSQDVDIDLTLDEEMGTSTSMAMLGGDGSLGNSADKPIELDLDLDVQMSDIASNIFGKQEGGGMQGERQQPGRNVDVDDLFSPPSTHGPDLPVIDTTTEGMDMSILNALSENQGHTDALFASLNEDNRRSDNSSETQQDSAGTVPGGTGADGSASFDYGQLGMGDMDMKDFFSTTNQEDMDMMAEFLTVGNANGVVGAGGSNSAAPPT